MNTVGRVGLWLGVIADVVNAVVQVFEIRRKNREKKQSAS